MESITSVNNPFFKYMLKLQARKYRQQEKKFLVEGIRITEEALAAGWPVECLVFSPGLSGNERGGQLLDKAERLGLKLVRVDERLLAMLAQTTTPQGVAALCPAREKDLPGLAGSLVERGKGLILVVDGVSDPGNLGTMVRSAHAFNAGGVVIMKDTVDLYNDKTIRATMGSLFHVPVITGACPDQVRYLSGSGFEILLGAPRGGVSPDSLNPAGPVVLVVGSEAGGPSPFLKEIPHRNLTIPMPGRAESLNAAVAASIMLYEIMNKISGLPG